MPRAASLAAELLNNFEPEIESVTLTPSDGGRFEVTVNDRLVFSKLQSHRHAEPGEVTRLIRQLLQEGYR
ncbi:MAG: SelT/SelW/SelH family protein [Chloroflexi bacterium]|jgi:selenoprotein W-related protein|nr:SelT/SelW/SelH family protein [Chloroflexota bacterium]